MPALEMKKINRMYFWASMGAVLQIVIASIIIQIIKLIINAAPNNELPSLSGIGSAISNIIAAIAAFVVVLKATKIFKLKDLFLKPKFTVFDTILACFVVKGLGSLITTYSKGPEFIIHETKPKYKIKDFFTKKYTQVPIGTIMAIVGSLLYVLSPIDIIPDIIPIVGYLDDAAVIGLCMKFVKVDLDKYKKFKGIN